MITDYFLIRGTKLDLDSLYRREGVYEYNKGVNWTAVGALAAGVSVALSGLAISAVRFLFDYWWFAGLAVAGQVYCAGMKSRAKGEAIGGEV